MTLMVVFLFFFFFSKRKTKYIEKKERLRERERERERERVFLFIVCLLFIFIVYYLCLLFVFVLMFVVCAQMCCTMLNEVMHMVKWGNSGYGMQNIKGKHWNKLQKRSRCCRSTLAAFSYAWLSDASSSAFSFLVRFEAYAFWYLQWEHKNTVMIF